MLGPCWVYVGPICWQYVGLCWALVCSKKDFSVSPWIFAFELQNEPLVLEPGWAMLGLVGPMLRCVGPMLGLCWAYARPFWAYVELMLRQERGVFLQGPKEHTFFGSLFVSPDLCWMLWFGLHVGAISVTLVNAFCFMSGPCWAYVRLGSMLGLCSAYVW